MFISEFVTCEPVTVLNKIMLKMAAVKNFLSRISVYFSYLTIILKYKFLYAHKIQSNSDEKPPVVANLPGQQAWFDQQDEYYQNKDRLCLDETTLFKVQHTEVWPLQDTFEHVRQTKLKSFASHPLHKLTKLFKRANEHGYSLQYAGLAMLTVPALIQIALGPILLSADKPGVLQDPVYTSSIAQKPAEPLPVKNIWATGWKIKSGKALQVFSLSSPETFELDLSYTSKIHASGLQEDAMHWVPPDSSKAFLLAASAMIVQRNRPPQGYDSQGIFDEMTMRVKAQGLSVEKFSFLSTIPSKFGPVEVVDMTVLDGTQSERSCSAFRTQSHQPNLKLSGWLCSDKNDLVERPQLTCFINRLDLVGGHDSATLQTIFQSAESRRGDCPLKSSYTQDASRKAANWLEIKGPLPTLKGAL